MHLISVRKHGNHVFILVYHLTVLHEMQKRHKRPRNSRYPLEDQQQEEGDGGDLDDLLEPLENGEEDEEILQDSPVHSENEDQDFTELDTTVSGISPESGSIKIICRFHSPQTFLIIFQACAYVVHIDMQGPMELCKSIGDVSQYPMS
jgi:hypothetical protein